MKLNIALISLLIGGSLAFTGCGGSSSSDSNGAASQTSDEIVAELGKEVYDCTKSGVDQDTQKQFTQKISANGKFKADCESNSILLVDDLSELSYTQATSTIKGVDEEGFQWEETFNLNTGVKTTKGVSPKDGSWDCTFTYDTSILEKTYYQNSTIWSLFGDLVWADGLQRTDTTCPAWLIALYDSNDDEDNDDGDDWTGTEALTLTITDTDGNESFIKMYDEVKK